MMMTTWPYHIHAKLLVINKCQSRTDSNSPKGVLKPIMGSPWKHKVACPKLLQKPQPLELWGVYYLHTQGVHLYVAMDGVVNYLCAHQWVSTF